MHQRTFARLQTLVALTGVLSAGLPHAVRAGVRSVDVLYAGSLVTPMQGPIETALHRRGIAFQGEPGGSKELANLIRAGIRTPDAFISVDPALVYGLGGRVARSVTFAGTSLGIAWSDASRFASVFDRVQGGKLSLRRALETAGLKIGRTDPRLDPKGAYTIEGASMWLGPTLERQLLGSDENPAQIFPEEVLLARIETGEADVGFFYRTEAIARGYRFVPLPGSAALTKRITYTLAIMRHAPHPAAANAFAAFILSGPGRTILERAGLTYLRPVIRADNR